jgi:hypothetical protein
MNDRHSEMSQRQPTSRLISEWRSFMPAPGEAGRIDRRAGVVIREIREIRG